MSTPKTSAPGEPRSGLEAVLRATQVLLFLAFTVTGSVKLVMSLAELNSIMPWTADMPVALVRFIGAAELAGALGVLFPSVTRIAPSLTPLAALGLTLVMVLATVTHLTRGELAEALPSVFLGALSLFVAWGRFAAAPVTPRAAPGRATGEPFGRAA